MRKTITDLGVRALKPRAKSYTVSDPELRGHYVRIEPSGSKAFWTIARTPAGKQVWTRVAPADMGIEQAREQARTMLQRVRAGLPAVEPKADTFAAVVDNWIKRVVEKQGFRSAKEVKRMLKAHVLPVLGEREFTSIRRSDVATLMDEIEDDHGARQADLVLGIVRSIMNWYATRDDDYRPPLVKGMRRIAPKDLERSRVLDDRELAAVWKVAEDNGTFGALILLLLLSGQRLRKVMAMRWQDITVDGVWTIQTEKDKKGKTREKSNAEELLLPEMALQIIRAQPRLGDNPYVLAGRGNSHTNNLSDGKKAFDKKLAEVLPNVERWVLHDLRRTARSLMSRADVRREHAERVLGHAIGGVEGTYDHHKYTAEKADALRKLAALIDSIVHPRPATVLPMKGRKKQNAGAAG